MTEEPLEAKDSDASSPGPSGGTAVTRRTLLGLVALAGATTVFIGAIEGWFSQAYSERITPSHEDVRLGLMAVALLLGASAMWMVRSVRRWPVILHGALATVPLVVMAVEIASVGAKQDLLPDATSSMTLSAWATVVGFGLCALGSLGWLSKTSGPAIIHLTRAGPIKTSDRLTAIGIVVSVASVGLTATFNVLEIKGDPDKVEFANALGVQVGVRVPPDATTKPIPLDKGETAAWPAGDHGQVALAWAIHRPINPVEEGLGDDLTGVAGMRRIITVREESVFTALVRNETDTPCDVFINGIDQDRTVEPGGEQRYGYADSDLDGPAVVLRCADQESILQSAWPGVDDPSVRDSESQRSPFEMIGSVVASVEDYDDHSARIRIVVSSIHTPTESPAPGTTPVPVPTLTPEPTPAATPVPVPTLTPEPTPAATQEPVPTPTPEPTARPVPDECPATRLEAQLDGSENAAYDAGRAVAVMEVDFATCGMVRPTTEVIGDRMDNQEGPSYTADRKVAIESYARSPELGGLEPLSYELFSAEPVSVMWESLVEGRPISATIDYGVIHYRADLRGSDTFRGFHTVWMRRAQEHEDGRREVCVYDPLADGRKDLPQGPQWWPWDLVQAAVSGVAGNGLWEGGQVSLPTLENGEVPSLHPGCE